jgi:hypothetical protein
MSYNRGDNCKSPSASFRRVTPVKTGAESSVLLVPGFRRDDVWTPAPVPDSDPGFAGVTEYVGFAIGSEVF